MHGIERVVGGRIRAEDVERTRGAARGDVDVGVELYPGIPVECHRSLLGESTTHWLEDALTSTLQISKTSALAVSLLGILKSPIPILTSLLVLHTPITFVQVMGYGVSLAGMFFYGLSPEGMGPQIDAWFGCAVSSSSEADTREAAEPIMSKATAYLGSLISIESRNGDEEAQRGRTVRRDGTPRPCPEKVRASLDSIASKGEAPNGKVAGRLD